MAGASHDGGEDGAGSIITGEPSLDQARAVVAHEGGGLVVVAHVWSFRMAFWIRRKRERESGRCSFK